MHQLLADLATRYVQRVDSFDETVASYERLGFEQVQAWDGGGEARSALFRTGPALLEVVETRVERPVPARVASRRGRPGSRRADRAARVVGRGFSGEGTLRSRAEGLLVRDRDEGRDGGGRRRAHARLERPRQPLGTPIRTDTGRRRTTPARGRRTGTRPGFAFAQAVPSGTLARRPAPGSRWSCGRGRRTAARRSGTSSAAGRTATPTFTGPRSAARATRTASSPSTPCSPRIIRRLRTACASRCSAGRGRAQASPAGTARSPRPSPRTEEHLSPRVRPPGRGDRAPAAVLAGDPPRALPRVRQRRGSLVQPDVHLDGRGVLGLGLLASGPRRPGSPHPSDPGSTTPRGSSTTTTTRARETGRSTPRTLRRWARRRRHAAAQPPRGRGFHRQGHAARRLRRVEVEQAHRRHSRARTVTCSRSAGSRSRQRHRLRPCALTPTPRSGRSTTAKSSSARGSRLTGGIVYLMYPPGDPAPAALAIGLRAKPDAS